MARGIDPRAGRVPSLARRARGSTRRGTPLVVVVLASVAALAPGPAMGRRADTSCPFGQVKITVDNRRRSAGPTAVVVSGRVTTAACSATPAHAAAYSQSLTIPATCSGSCACGAGNVCRCEPGGVPRCETTLKNLSPGEWLHGVEVSATMQQQHRRSLLMGDSAKAATLQWTVYRSVHTITSDLDDGSAGTLRNAIATASGERAEPPTLIQFDHHRFPDGLITVRLTNTRPLRVGKETVIDGTDADGNPSPLSPFARRSYKTVIELDPDDTTAANAAALRLNRAGSGLRGVYLRRILGADSLIARRDQDLVAFGSGARRGFVEACKLDGGSAHRVMQDCPANTPTSATNPAQGKDCIDVEGTGSLTFDDAVVVSDSELRHCYDRALKSQNAAAIVRDSWVHNNSRGGLFAQSRNGKLRALRNLLEENGKNCPSATRCRGGPRDGMSCCPAGVTGSICAALPGLPGDCPGSGDPGCGSGTCVPLADATDVSDGACGVSGTRRAAAQLSAESGGGTDLRTQGNVVRNGMRDGVFFRNGSTGAVRDDFICGMQFGIETTTKAGSAGPVVVGGTATVLNRNAGVLLNRSGAAIADITFGDAAARTGTGMHNAFSRNGGSGSPTNFSMGAGAPARKAERNQWQHGGDGATCRASAVSANDVTPANAQLDVDPCEAPRHPSEGTAVVDVLPKSARLGGIVHVIGTGFNAIDGIGGLDASGDAKRCTTLAAGNTCGPIPRGTCVEFERADGAWSPASAVLAVTPTHLVVESPIDCAAPRRIRVRQQRADGRSETFTSRTAIFCRNE